MYIYIYRGFRIEDLGLRIQDPGLKVLGCCPSKGGSNGKTMVAEMGTGIAYSLS